MTNRDKLCSYVAGYIEYEKSEYDNSDIDQSMIDDAIDAFCGGANDSVDYIVHIFPKTL